ncbi:MAG: TrkH family potassium uptake protein [Clostridia bacterium]|nr:TrkH family potassium uptake protein [Clostridia bacterium]
MNYKLLGRILGKIMILESILMIAPLIVSIGYNEGTKNIIAFIVPICALALLGGLMQIPKPERRSLYQKEGFALTALVWIIMTLFGAIPFVINGDIPYYHDACFEIMSGFTTTGSSIITDITAISHSSLFWRSFAHWIGGMGILVFVLIFIPESNEGSSMHLLRAESPGPQVGKIVSKMKVTSRILYLIYLGMTVLEVIILMCGPIIDYSVTDAVVGIDYRNDKFFHALLTSFGCAGTGGFGFIPNSLEFFTPFAQYVVSIFLILFGCNFALYYLILIGKAKHILKSEEFKSYILIIVVSVGLVFGSLLSKLQLFGYSPEESFRHSLLQVTSLLTTTGFTSTDYNLWPTLAVTVLVLVMIFGAMAGSTAGGIKISRVVIALKGIYVSIRKLINPRYVPKTKFEGKSLNEKTTNDVFSFIALYFFIIFGVTLLLSFDPVNGQTFVINSDLGAVANPESGTYTVTHGFFSNLSASIACISNIGPAFEAVGPYSSYAGYNAFSTILLTFTMLIGRLEILPVLILFTPRTWKKT